MPIEVVTMYDTVHSAASHIPANAVKVAGYDSGTPDIQWTMGDWARFPHAGKVRIDQSAAGLDYGQGISDVYDIETGAGTATMFAALALSRHSRDMSNCPYASRINLEAAATALDAKPAPAGWWRGMDAWLTDPNLSFAEATALVGTDLFGFTLRAVQWAWPSTNPNTQVPGGTLKSLNLDLSVADAAWHPAPPAAPTWQAQAANELAGAQVHLANLSRLLQAHMAA